MVDLSSSLCGCLGDLASQEPSYRSPYRIPRQDRQMTARDGDFLWGYPQIIWVNYNELTTSSLEIIVSKGNHPQMALIQVSEIL